MLPSRTLSISIACPPDEVTRFVADPRHLPVWASAFCQAVRQVGDNWIVETAQGELGIRFVAGADNRFGILDHEVTLPSGETIYVPMRALANGTGSEILLTVFQAPGMSAAQFTDDQAAVTRDLQNLQRHLGSR